MSESRSGQATAPRRTRAADRLEDTGIPLIEMTVDRWESLPDRQTYLVELNSAFHEYLNELIASANVCVDGYDRYCSSHSWWRKTIIVGTGVVAALNLIAAYRWDPKLGPPLSLVAAVAAVTLSVLANLESFGN